MRVVASSKEERDGWVKEFNAIKSEIEMKQKKTHGNIEYNIYNFSDLLYIRSLTLLFAEAALKKSQERAEEVKTSLMSQYRDLRANSTQSSRARRAATLNDSKAKYGRSGSTGGLPIAETQSPVTSPNMPRRVSSADVTPTTSPSHNSVDSKPETPRRDSRVERFKTSFQDLLREVKDRSKLNN